METVTIPVKGMSCQHCVNAIESALREVEVESRVDLNAGQVRVTYPADRIDLGRIGAIIEDQGYEVEAVRDN